MNIKNQLSIAAAGGSQLGSGLRRIVCLAALLVVFFVGARADVEINEQNFPDDKFREWLLQQDYGYDEYISDDELMRVEYMDVSSRSIASLKGIEFFTALTVLRCYHNRLTELDVSKNTALTELNCPFNQLTTLDVSGCTALTVLRCYNNQLTSLDVSGCTALTEVFCGNNDLHSLSASGCTALRLLSCDNNKLTSLDVSGCTALKLLGCYSNQIRGAGMATLITSLPTVTSGIGIFQVDTPSAPDGNLITTVQMAAAMAKGWCVMTGQEVCAIDEDNFPDEKFRNWLLGKDYGADGVLTGEEIGAITTLDVHGLGIKHLDGIQYFMALTELNCSFNRLTALDVSQNMALTELNCSGNQLTALDVSQNTALTELYCRDNQLTSLDVSQNTALTKLSCDNNKLTSLDVSNNTALTTLNCDNNKLTSLDVSNNTALTTLNCGSNRLTSLDVSQNTALTYLYCSSNRLTALDMTKNTKLISLNCSFNQLTSLDVSGCTALTELRCYGNQIRGAGMATLITSLPTVMSGTGNFYVYIPSGTNGNVMTIVQVAAAKAKGWSVWTVGGGDYAGAVCAIDEDNFPDEKFRNWLFGNDYGADGALTGEEIGAITTLDVSGLGIEDLSGIQFFTALTGLNCSGNQLTSLDVSGCTALTDLNCGFNRLTSLDVSQNTALTQMDCSWNQLTALDVSQNTALDGLYCSGNQLTALDLSKNTALTGLDCCCNQLTSLDVSSCTALGYLYCYDNQLTSLDVSKHTELDRLECFSNRLTSLDVSKSTMLRYLDCCYNGLTSLDMSQNTELEVLYASLNALTSLDVSGCPVLMELRCDGNGDMTSLDVSKNTALEILWCDGIPLTSLDVSQNTALYELRCSYNNLTTLDVSKNTALTYLDCHRNQIRGKGMTDFVKSLRTTGGSLYVYEDGDDNLITPKQVEVAKSKNWGVYLFGVYEDGWKPVAYEGEPADGIGISEGNFPDAAFRAYVSQEAIDKDEDGYLSDEEIAAVTSIDVSTMDIFNLTGIEYFTALNVLDCSRNQIRGAAMTALVNSLPDWNSAYQGKLYVYRDETPAGNLMNPKQVEVATSKNWSVLRYDVDTDEWIAYKGETFPGDANGDGEMTEADLEMVRDLVLGISSSGYEEGADLNGDSTVDIQDLTQLIKLLTE